MASRAAFRHVQALGGRFARRQSTLGPVAEREHMEHWKKIAVAGAGLSAVYWVMSLFADHEHKEDETPYPHMRMRDKVMPWKSDCPMLDWDCHRQYKLAKADAQ